MSVTRSAVNTLGGKRASVVSLQNAALIGVSPASCQLARDLFQHPKTGIVPVAFVDESPSVSASEALTLPIYDQLQELGQYIEREDIRLIFLDLQQDDLVRRVRDQVNQSGKRGVTIWNIADYYERVWHKVPPVCVQQDWFAQEGFFRLNDSSQEAGKRVFDLFFATILFLFLLPVMLLAALLIKLDSPGPIFYSQTRTGKNGKPFRVHKFRSMFVDAEKRGAQWATERDPRITRVGRFLRATRIDELPQLWNVFRGDMSLIGPRPERPEFDTRLAEQIPHYHSRYTVRPGLSGWAQVMYPYGSSVDDAREKLAYDLYYLKNSSPLLDLQITWKTLQVVLFGKGR